MNSSILRIGTRGSELASWQANWVAEQLRAQGVQCELVKIATRGDQLPHASIEAIGTLGVFTKELQKALLDGRIDVSVHSLKDLPTEPVKALALSAVPERESPMDVLVSRNNIPLKQLPKAARIGTGSLRRMSQLRHIRPDLQLSDIRGNVDSRLRKLDDGQYDALILAEAGLKRLGLAGRITEVLSPDQMLPAVGQGALGLETRAHDTAAREAVARIDDLASHQAVLAERTLLATLRGGCLAPVGAWGRLEDDGRLKLTACVLSRNGTKRLFGEHLGNAADAVQIGRQVAEDLLAEGAGAFIEAARATG
ncbi:MAG: hydroxymethylbilane synthase [Pirellulales bacterium]|nr:hydroxymethylbilane synthase [Pirellulales bacterium]